MPSKLRVVVAVIAMNAASWGGGAPAGRTSGDLVTGADRVFVSGGSSGIEKLATPWPHRQVQWVAQSKAGTVASGRSQTDEAGTASLHFDVPGVRSVVHLDLVIAPIGWAESARRSVDVVVLPKNVFSGFTNVLGDMGIGVLFCRVCQTVLRRCELAYTELDHEVERIGFRGRVVVLSGPLPRGPSVTDAWIDSLPAGTSIVVFGNDRWDSSSLSALGYLTADSPPEATKELSVKESAVWTDLSAGWLGTTCPRRRLSQPRWVTSLRVLAGRVASDGTIYPLVVESQDTRGRWWLVWSLPESFAPTDPRWPLLLRNSLLWAHEKTPGQKPGSIPSGGNSP